MREKSSTSEILSDVAATWAASSPDLEIAGNFSIAIVTGGMDETATQIQPYLLPQTVESSHILGDSIPDGIKKAAVASASVSR